MLSMTFARIVPLLALAIAMCARGQEPAWCASAPRPEFQSLRRVPVSQPWFEVYALAPGVFSIHELRQAQQTISYLIIGAKQALLFDTGMGIGDIKKVTAELTSLPVEVLNSHTHHDHVGGNWQFRSVSGMDTAFTRHNAEGSREEAQAEIATGQVCGQLPIGFDAKAYETRAWPIAVTRRDGDRIDLGGRTLEILSTPGHTPDSICLLDRANGMLFTGDTYYRGTVWLYRRETDLEAYGASIRRLAALAPAIKSVHGAHNVPFAPSSVLDALASAFAEVRSGRAQPAPAAAGQIRYKVGDIGFLLRAP